MKYFTTAKTLDEAKTLYKKLALENHPDKGGDTLVMQEINAEFDEVFLFLKHTAKKEAKPVSPETSTDYKRSFYTANGWQGDRYDPNLRTKDIAKIMRDYVKYAYPTFKFSVRAPDYNSIHISMTQAPVNMFISIEEAKKILDTWGEPCVHSLHCVENKSVDVNHFYIENNKVLTDYAKHIMIDIHEFLKAYQFDDSDSMTDYFNTNFYESLSVGSWNKPLEIVEKRARLYGKENKEAIRLN